MLSGPAGLLVAGAAEAAFASYGGSESCRNCHQPEYDLWAKSNHGLAERVLHPELDGVAFDPVHRFGHAPQTSEARFHEGEAQIVTLGFRTNIEPYRVERVIGNDPLRQFLTPAPGGRWQVQQEAYDPKANEWFDVYGDDGRQPGEWGHWTGRGMNWNSRCADCHNTRLQKNYDAATDSYHTTMAEMSVGCEACHGPLKAHNAWRAAHPDTKEPGPTVTPVNKAGVIGACGSCHSRRDLLTGDFAPGDSFYDHFWLEILDDAGRWYPDGQIKEEDYEFESFLGSKMDASGVSCLDCHNPHSMNTVLPGKALCMRCHQGNAAGFTNAPVINPATHGHHNLADKGGECIGCHMPVTVYMQRQPRHDHGFTIPDPLLTRELGIPNACTRCHADKSVDWALDYTQQWYGTNMNRHTRERARWIAAAQQGDDRAKDHLTGMLTGKTESPYWRAVAAGLLWHWADEPGVKAALLAGLKDEHPLVREKAVRALESLVTTGDAGTIGALKTALNDPMRNVRAVAAGVLRASVDLHTRAGGEMMAALDLDGDQPAGQYKLAMVEVSRGQTSDAVARLRKAIDWDPFSPPLRYEAATQLAQLGRHTEAAEELEAACRLEPQSSEARYRLGVEWAELHKFDQAVAALEEAVKLDPQNVQAWYNLGVAHSSSGKIDEAMDALRHAENLAPENPQIPYAEAKILARAKRFVEARAAASRALNLEPDFQPAQELLKSLPADASVPSP